MSSTTNPAPTKTDSFPTETSNEQLRTEALIAQSIPPSDSTKSPTLERNVHLNFLVRLLTQGFPARYVSQDASQPWLVYWIMQGISILGAGMDPDTKRKIVDTVLSFQHPDGGFGGGPQQFPHLLTTYASVCALAIVGKPGPGGGWDAIDRKKLYQFYMSLKQPDGSFLVAKDQEVDVRGTYCLLVCATLLDLLTPELVHNTPEFIASCQTYEGGFASSSIVSTTASAALGEAHGGYTSCALASWVLLHQAGYITSPLASTPNSPPPPSINVQNLTRWLAHMQGSPAEMGGFKGRTNKLVDGCYSWWVGGAFALLGALGVPSPLPAPDPAGGGGEWVDMNDDDDDSLFDRKALQEYIIHVAQSETGGLRDKPKKPADAYHTLYNLAGLSSAQHRIQPSPTLRAKLEEEWVYPRPPWSPSQSKASTAATAQSKDPAQERRKTIWANSLSWVEDEDVAVYVGGKSNRVNASHPLFNLTVSHVKGIMNHFYGQRC